MVRSIIAALLILLVLAACAPEDLDITPTLTPTNTPEPTATRAPTATPNPDATEEVEASADSSEAAELSGSSQEMVDQMLALLPDTIVAGRATWRKVSDEATYIQLPNGVTGRISFTEAAGSQADVTIGVFDTPEGALEYWQRIADRLPGAEQNDAYPQPNVFGSGGTYGLDSVLLMDTIYMRVAIPQASSAVGNPLEPMVQAVLSYLEPLGIVPESSNE